MYRYAKIGYEAYGETTGNKPRWEEPPEKIQEAWKAATEAALSAKAKDNISGY
jgi:hypothetical protein